MKKCIVLDLDNTLWGGIVGEVGTGGIDLGLDDRGANFVAFQQMLLDLYGQGFILAINSKNNLNDAMEVIRDHPHMVLREKHFGALRINWEDKVENMQSIAKELNIDLNSLVFLDDDPTNRSLVKALLPEVEVPDLPENPELYTRFLMDLPYLRNRNNVVTDEDKMRGNMYVTERLRMASEKNFSSRAEFLRSLKIEVICYENDTSCLPRLAQMSERTNQFNMNKNPLTEKEIEDCIRNLDHDVYYMSACDKFGDYGVIGFALVRGEEKESVIESMLMSCRVIGRGVEDAFLHFLAGKAKKNGKEALRIVFKKSLKNKPAEEFLKRYFLNNTRDLSMDIEQPSWVTITHGGK